MLELSRPHRGKDRIVAINDEVSSEVLGKAYPRKGHLVRVVRHIGSPKAVLWSECIHCSTTCGMPLERATAKHTTRPRRSSGSNPAWVAVESMLTKTPSR